MVKRIFISTVFLVLLIFFGCTVAMAGKKEPKGYLTSFCYNMGGGMEISIQDEVYLRLKDDGKRLLTLRGSCYFERITFEVGEDVFLRCDSIIRATKLYKSEGYYKPEIMVLDAPSSGFSAYYDDKGLYQMINGNGDMPDEIWKGMHAVVNYLKSLRGGREAKGHMAKQEFLKTTELIKGTEWVDGPVTYKPEEDIEELPRFLSQLYGFDYVADDWILSLAEGNGQRCITLINYKQEIYDVFVDKNTEGVVMAGTDDVPGRWPQTSQRVLTKNEIASMPSDSLTLMADEIRARHRFSSYFDSKQHDAYFKTQPWYKAGYDIGPTTDIENQNFELIRFLYHRRKLEAKQQSEK